MNQNDIQLKYDVMRRVWAIYYMRSALDSVWIKSGLFATTATALAFMVSVPHVIMNLYSLHNILADEPFLWNAFLHTNISVQVVIVLMALCLLMLARDMLNGLRTHGWFLNMRAA